MRNSIQSHLSFLLSLLVWSFLCGACTPTTFNPGDPASREFWEQRLLACVINESSCPRPAPACNLTSGAFEACTLNLTGTVTTLAGSGNNATGDGLGTAADIGNPRGIVSDGANLYVSQVHSNVIMKIDSSGMTTTLAGSSTGFAEGIGTAAQFNTLRTLLTDGTYLYIADAFNQRIRRMELATANVTTLAGDGNNTHNDAVGTAASFNFPQGIALVGSALYIADSGNQVLRRIEGGSLAVSTPAGMVGITGAADAVGNSASFNQLFTMVSPDGANLYITDYANHSIRKLDLNTNEVTTFAGLSGVSGHADGDLSTARFNQPRGITTDGSALYIADGGNDTIRKIDLSTSMVTTVAGLAGTNGGGPGYADGIGSAVRFDEPNGIAHDGTYLYVADALNNRIRRIE